MTDLTPRIRATIYIVAIAALIACAIVGIVSKQEAFEYIAYVAGILGLGTAVQYRPTLTTSERDEAAQIKKAAESVVGLAHAEAPEDVMAAAVDHLGAQVKK